MMRRHSIVVRLDATDTRHVSIADRDSQTTTLRFIKANRRLDHGVGQMLDRLAARGLLPSETAVDLALLAATVTAADTTISRVEHGQDSWTREIHLYLPVAAPDLWSANAPLIERTLDFLTGDLWRVGFRARSGSKSLARRARVRRPPANCDRVALFSGGLDSFVGAIDLLEQGAHPIFVSHYHDASTKSQAICAANLGEIYGDLGPRHVRANVSFDRNDLAGLGTETTTRARSFLFIALAALAASAIKGSTPIIVPENGLIALNVPLDSLRIGALSTRTTHPFYLARWQELLANLGIDAALCNPYRLKTKGEMLAGCKNKSFLQANVDRTISCSSISKSRWQGRKPEHCGYCVPCLIRRAAIRAAFGIDPTGYTVADLDARPLDPTKKESVAVRAFQGMSRRLSDRPELAGVLVHAPGPLADYSAAEVAHYAGVFERGIAEVSALVNTAVIRGP